jgi:hypothetical protein
MEHRFCSSRPQLEASRLVVRGELYYTGTVRGNDSPRKWILPLFFFLFFIDKSVQKDQYKKIRLSKSPVAQKTPVQKTQYKTPS